MVVVGDGPSHGVVRVLPGAEVLVPEPVDDAEHGEGGGDQDEDLVLEGGPLVGHVLVPAPLEHRLVDRVEADGVRVGALGHLVEVRVLEEDKN